jgi:hypothetical protein
MSSVAALSPATLAPAETTGTHVYIVSPLYDSVFFTLSPVFALGGLALVGALGMTVPQMLVLNQIFVQAHLVLVFLRSHANRNIFKRFPVRFTVVPVVLMTAVALSRTVAILVVVVGFFWDIYHSAQQTFGLARIYDRMAGNDAELHRTADRWLNHLIYVGPIIAGLAFVSNLKPFNLLGDVGWTIFTYVPAYGNAWHAWLTVLIVAIAVPFLGWYCWRTWELHRDGFKVSVPKITLLVSTAFVSILVWGFWPLGAGLFVSNLFHAMQYFALVAHTERHTISSRLGRENDRWDFGATWMVMLALGISYGAWVSFFLAGHNIVSGYDSLAIRLAFAVSLTISILHFWYDGFIWSVRKKLV